jgi:hypothetical protein
VADAPDLLIHWKDYAYFTKKGIDKAGQIFSSELTLDAQAVHAATRRSQRRRVHLPKLTRLRPRSAQSRHSPLTRSHRVGPALTSVDHGATWTVA